MKKDKRMPKRQSKKINHSQILHEELLAIEKVHDVLKNFPEMRRSRIMSNVQSFLKFEVDQ